MALLRPDPTFYPSPRLAMQAPPERLAYVAALNPPGSKLHDAILVIDVDPASPAMASASGKPFFPMPETNCTTLVGMPAARHFVPMRHIPTSNAAIWLCRVSALRASTCWIPSRIRAILPIVKIIQPEEVFARTGYSRPHTVHCGPDGIYVSALGSPSGDGPGGIFLLDHFSFDVLGKWEMDRGPQYLGYDFWWHLTQDTLLTSEWGTPNQIENGIIPEELLQSKYGHQLHVWDLRKRRHVQALDLGKEHQMVLEMRPAHDPTKTYGFVGVVVSLKDLSASIWLWHRQNGSWQIQKSSKSPPRRQSRINFPPLLKGFNAVPPLVTDINLSLDDRFLYVSCWGTGEMQQYDVSDPFNPKKTGSVHIGGIVRQTPHPAKPEQPLLGGPQMVEVSRDGKRDLFHQLALRRVGRAILSHGRWKLDDKARRQL